MAEGTVLDLSLVAWNLVLALGDPGQAACKDALWVPVCWPLKWGTAVASATSVPRPSTKSHKATRTSPLLGPQMDTLGIGPNPSRPLFSPTAWSFSPKNCEGRHLSVREVDPSVWTCAYC